MRRPLQTDSTPQPTWANFIAVFARIGLLSFGGPAAQIALMQTELVDRHKLLSQDAFLRALSFCMLLPGPEAMQLATYAGWRLRGTLGGLVAGGLFVLPGACVIAILAWIYLTWGNLPLVRAALTGVQAAVIAIVIKALHGLVQRALTGRGMLWVAGLSFVAIFAMNVPFPVILACAALAGVWRTQPLPSDAAPPAQKAPVPTGHLPRTLLIWGSLWAAPLIALWVAGSGFLLEVAAFFSWLAVVTFGGAYAVLAYMTQSVVVAKGWLDTTQMIDALGLAETTPGPLILVTEFVAIVAGAAQGGPAMAVWAGLLALWVTFVPCFLWIFAGAPFVERLAQMPRLSAALEGVTAAVVGVIANLALWFALHVLFADLTTLTLGPARLILPDIASLKPVAAGLVILSCAALLWARWPLGWVLLGAAILACCAALAGFPA